MESPVRPTSVCDGLITGFNVAEPWLVEARHHRGLSSNATNLVLLYANLYLLLFFQFCDSAVIILFKFSCRLGLQ